MINPVNGHVISTPDGYKRYCSKEKCYVPVPVQNVYGKVIKSKIYRGSVKEKIESIKESIVESKQIESDIEEEISE